MNQTVSAAYARQRAEQLFSGTILFRAGTIVADHIEGNIDHTQYEAKRDRLAESTDYPSILKVYMDFHAQRRIQRPDIIHVTICE